MWVNERGELYTGDCAAGDREATTEEVAARALSGARSEKAQAIAKAVAHEIAWGLVWQGVVYQIDSVSQGRIGNRAQVARDCLANVRTWLPIYSGWIAADNSREVEFTPSAFLDFAYAAHDHFTLITLNANALKKQLEDALSIEDIEAIDVNAGWPEQE